MKRWRCQAYLDWVKTLPCVVTGQPADDAHHMKGHGMGGTVTAPDWAVFPLTRTAHTYFHDVGWKSWEAEHGSQWEFVAKTLGKAIELGIIGFEKKRAQT